VKTEAERTALKRAPDAKATERPKNPILRFLGELPGLVIMALVLAVLIKTFLFQAFYIPSASMEPTLHGCPGCSGDRVLVTKIPYYFGDPKRGDIIVFEDPDPAKRPDRGLIGGFAHWLFQGRRGSEARQRGLHQAGDRVAGRYRLGEGRQGVRERHRRSPSHIYRTSEDARFPTHEGPEGLLLRDGRQPFELARLPVRARVHPARRDHRQGVLPGLASVPVDRSLANRIPG
jgi:signal peptidase I